MRLPMTGALRHDIAGAEEISIFSGHWDGAGEPARHSSAASAPATPRAASRVCGSRSVTSMTAGPPRPEGVQHVHWGIPRLPARADQHARPALEPDGSGAHALREARGPRLQGHRPRRSGRLGRHLRQRPHRRAARRPRSFNGEQSFSFPGSYGPFTWIKSVPTFQRGSTPVESMTVRIETGNRRSAGTDDNISLNIGSHRFSLDKRLYDDFRARRRRHVQRADRSCDPRRPHHRDIRRVSIEKSKDGIAGGWFLHGVSLRVNGRTLVRDRNIDRWLEDSKRVWRPSSFTRDNRTADVVPVWLALREDDFGPQDTGDINIFDRHLAADRVRARHGREGEGDRLGPAAAARLSMDNGDKARVTYRISSFEVAHPPPPPVPPPQQGRPPPPPPGPSGDADLDRHLIYPEQCHGQEPGDRGHWAVHHHRVPRVHGSELRCRSPDWRRARRRP